MDYVMTKLSTTLTLSAIASILIIGGFAAATPNAFSTYGGWHDDDDDDDCDDWHYGYYNDDDDCGHDEPKDPCDCEKPDTLKFTFSAPANELLPTTKWFNCWSRKVDFRKQLSIQFSKNCRRHQAFSLI